MTVGAPQLWHRKGLLLTPPARHEWWVSHAQLPTVLQVSERLWRIYFAARDRENRSRILAVDVDPASNMRIVAEHFDTLLDLGSVGTFDHFGVVPACSLVVNGEMRLYYIGVFVRADVRGATAIGLALSNEGAMLRRHFPGPVYGVGPLDPYFSTGPFVTTDPAGFRMYYVAGTAWHTIDGVLDPFYCLRTTTSPDGLFWHPRSQAVLTPGDPLELCQGRPWVTGQEDRRRVWYSQRGVSYRGPGEDAYLLASVALNEDGLARGTVEPVVFDNPPVDGDFDSWMQAYACILPYEDDLIMVYNGNGFGQTGIGWARLAGGAGLAR